MKPVRIMIGSFLAVMFVFLSVLATANAAESESSTVQGGKEIADTNEMSSGELFTVSFESNGGAALESRTAASGSTVADPGKPEKAGSSFGCWCKDPACLDEWDFDSDKVTHNITLYARWKKDGSPFFGEGSNALPYIINSGEALHTLAALVNNDTDNPVYAPCCYAQTKDIDLSGFVSWEPIGSGGNYFKGNYNGNGKKITGLNIEMSVTKESYIGLFGFIYGKTTGKGSVSNLTVTDVRIRVDARSATSIGSIVGEMMGGKLENCSASGSVGYSNGSDPSIYYNTCSGGLIGYAVENCTIKNCSYEGSVNAIGGGASAGGIAGALWENCTVENCFNSGAVYARGTWIKAGGITGRSIPTSSQNRIALCGNIGTVRQYEDLYHPDNSAGGIIGYGSKTDISECFNGAPVLIEGKDTDIGHTGGIIGIREKTGGSVSNCYNAGPIQGQITGGIAGKVSGEPADIGNCYYIDSCGKAVGDGPGDAYKKTSNELQQQATFSGFNFTDTWTLDDRDETKYAYPQLQKHVFHIQKKRLDLAVKGGVGGTLQGAGRYMPYENVPIKAIPDAGYRFLKWIYDPKAVLFTGDTQPEGSFPMPNADITIQAEFEKRKFTVTLQCSGNGTASGGGTYTWGDKVMLTAAPAEGYELKEWEVSGGASLDSMNMVTGFTMPISDVTIRAIFGELPTGYISVTWNSMTTIEKYYGKETDVVVPQRLKGYPVTVIGEKAFEACKSLKTVVLPEGLKSIGDYAFSNCPDLSSVQLPKSLVSIGDHAFSNCPKLSGVKLPEGLASIGVEAFASCTSLSSISLPDSVITMGGLAFGNCMSLQKLEIGKGLKTLSTNPFLGCYKLDTITVDPDNPYFTSDKDILFDESKESIIVYPNGKFGTYTIPGSVKNIHEYAFFMCKYLTEITIPESVNAIGKSAFCQCEALRSVHIPDSVSVIDSSTFSGCKSLQDAVLSKNLEVIKGSAFFGCSAMQHIDLPASLNEIGDMVFMDCDSLKGAYFWGGYPQWFGSNVFAGTASDFKLYYHASANWGAYTTGSKQAFCLLTLDLKDGSKPVTKIACLDAFRIRSINEPTRTGYDFKNWCTDENCEHTWSANTDVFGDLYLYAKWEPKPCTVSFYADGVWLANQSVVYGNRAAKPEDPEKDGYRCIGWREQDNAIWDFDKGSIIGDTKLYAVWKPREYTVKLDPEQGALNQNELAVTFGEKYGTLPKPNRIGYTFDSWYTQKGGAGTRITSSTTVSTAGNHTLYAKWNENTRFTITLTLNNPAYGTVSGTESYLEGETAVFTAKPNPGYLFLGWAENGRRVRTDYIYEFIVTKDRSVKAEFSPIGKPPLKKADSAGKGKIKVKWTSVSHATGYYIYRSGKSGSGFKLAGETSTYYFTDKGLKKGKSTITECGPFIRPEL